MRIKAPEDRASADSSARMLLTVPSYLPARLSDSFESWFDSFVSFIRIKVSRIWVLSIYIIFPIFQVAFTGFREKMRS